VPLVQVARDRPAGDRKQHRVELFLGALLDQDLPALAVERQKVGASEGDEVANELRGGARRRRLDSNASDGWVPSGGRDSVSQLVCT
jgi:hypothetical protein